MSAGKKYILAAVCLLTGVLLLPPLVVSFLAVTEHTRVLIRQSKQLEQLLAAGATFTEITNKLGRPEELSGSEAEKLVKLLAIDDERAVAMAKKYPKTLFFMVDGNTTVFVFLDGTNRMADYALGGQ